MNKELLQRAKDEAARERGCASWADFKLLNRAFGAVTKKDADLDFILDRAMEIYAERESKRFAEWIAQNCRMYENEFSLYNLNEDVLEIRPVSELYELFNLFKTTKP